MENITSAKQVLAVVKDTGAKMIKLVGTDGNVLVSANGPKVDINAKASEIEKVLKSEYMPDGVYVLELYMHSKAQPTKINIYKGSPENIAKTTFVTQTLNDDSKNEIAALNEKIDKLYLLLNDSELDDEEEEEELSEPESKFGWIKDCVTAVLPAIDKHFELSERKLKLEESKIGLSESSNTGNLLDFTISVLQKIDDPDKAQAALIDLQKSNLNLYNQVLNWYKQNRQNNSNEQAT